MTLDNLLSILTAVLPTVILLFGGQRLLNRFEISRKTKEQEIELLRTVREKQYEAVQALYSSFAKLMALYRSINNSITNLDDPETRAHLLQQAINAESDIDALILRIGCEFASGSQDELEHLLGNLRQSVHLWRESIVTGQKLPFYSSAQTDYVRFKESFAGTAAFMVHQIQNRLEPPQMRMAESKSLLLGVFSNKYECEDHKPATGENAYKSPVVA
jgi:hypothetical protein